LVIVSQQGRNNEAARRIVRAQAARASAAQSRVTRARNREERGWGGQRESGPSTALLSDPSRVEQALSPGSGSLERDSNFGPLSTWLGGIVPISATATTERAAALAARVRPSETGAIDPSAPTDVRGGLLRSTMSEGAPSGGTPGLKLPLATPKGFAALQSRIAVSDALLNLISRTACVDFASPGEEARLNELLIDLVIFAAGSTLTIQPSHPVQAHIRVACVCLTIFQGQRANGAVFANDPKYRDGLEAAWVEATLLDVGALAEPKAAEASLWAVFMISVTTGATANFFRATLQELIHDLQLRCWEQVRKVLLDFIYPVSFLDEPCKTFYYGLRQMQIALG